LTEAKAIITQSSASNDSLREKTSVKIPYFSTNQQNRIVNTAALFSPLLSRIWPGLSVFLVPCFPERLIRNCSNQQETDDLSQTLFDDFGRLFG
jgi:hypothetical protein